MNYLQIIFYVVFLFSSFNCVKAQTQVKTTSKSLLQEWNQPFKSFRIIGNLYYVGTNNLACFLITSPTGHILLDTGLKESVPIVSANITGLGFQLKDIKIILSSHAHFDHVAGHAMMQKITGAKVYAMDADAQILESGGVKGFHPFSSYEPVKVDKILKDGEEIRYGNLTLTAHLTAGHTEGNTTWTTTIMEKGEKYNVVFAGSMSINEGVKLIENTAWPAISQAYAKSFQVLKTLPCDIFLGPHAPFFDLEGKVKQLQAKPNSNPFMDSQGFHNYIASFEKAYTEQLQREKAGK